MDESTQDQKPPSAANPLPPDAAQTLVRLLDEYLAALQVGEAPDRAALVAAHPELASRLESCLAALDFIHRAGQETPDAPARLGDYQILREIGRGGMGVVYEAEQISLRRRVALKVLRFGGAVDADALSRFQREAETVAGLHHTNIVPIFAVGCEAGVHFFAMQLIDGRSLAAVLAAVPSGATSPSAREVALWGVQAAEALAHAHSRGVVHRDVKPSNLLLDAQGILWLTDFGLARRADELTLTVAGVLLGTPRYMSPEQAAAVAQRPVDQRSDIYSLGATLYELATRRPVFEGKTPQEVLGQVLGQEPIPPRQHRREVPRDLETILLKCLAKEPAARFATAQELADDLRRFSNGDAIRARRPSVWAQVRRWTARKSRVAQVVALRIFLCALGVWAGLVMQLNTEEPRPEEPRPTGQVSIELAEGFALGRAEVFDAEGRSIITPFTVPTSSPVTLPAGWHTLRLDFHEKLSENYQLVVEPGSSAVYKLGEDDHRLWDPLPVKIGHILSFDGKLAKGKKLIDEALRGVGIISIEPDPTWQMTNHPPFRGRPLMEPGWGMRRLDGKTGKELWKCSLEQKEHPALAELGEKEWIRVVQALAEKAPPLQPAPDLDGDGVADLVWTFQPHVKFGSYGGVEEPSWKEQTLVIVQSGATGKVLWWYRASSSLAVLGGTPLVIEDIDGDSIPDLILPWAAAPEVVNIGGWEDFIRHTFIFRGWVEAVSGRTGKRVWQYDFGSQFNFRPCPLNGDCDYEVRKTNKALLESQVGLLGMGWQGPLLTAYYKPLLTAYYKPANRYCYQQLDLPANSITLRYTNQKDQKVLFACGFKEVWWLDPKTGFPLPQRPPLSLPAPSHGWSADGRWALIGSLSIPDYSDPVVGKLAWIDTSTGKINEWNGNKSLKPLKAIQPWFPRRPPIRAIESDRNVSPGWIGYLEVEGDFDSNGVRKFFYLTAINNYRNSKLEVSGTGLNGWRQVIPNATWDDAVQKKIGFFGFWRPDSRVKGWLVVSHRNNRGETYLLNPESGVIEHSWPGVVAAGVADLNGDGWPDLYGFGEKGLYTLRGWPQELWRGAGRWVPRVGGQDEPFGSRDWPFWTSVPQPGNPLIVAPLGCSEDLNGDGIPDLLVLGSRNKKNRQVISEQPFQIQGKNADETRTHLQAYCGKTGRVLWETSPLEVGDQSKIRSLEVLDLETK